MTNAMTATESRIVNGVKRTIAPTFQEIRAQDQVPGPDEYFGEAPGKAFCGEAFSVPNSFYFSEEQAQKEAKKLWPNVWRIAGRIEKLPTVGSVFVHDLLDESILIVRASETELRAFRNTCPHRGNQLRKPGSCGVINKFFCPYHGATWNLDGTTDKWPFPYEFSHFEEDQPGRDLNEVAVDVFDGFIFVCTGKDPMPLLDYLGALPKYVRRRNWNELYPVLQVKKPLNCNWKVVVQAFSEAIHIPITHPQGRAVSNVSGSQVDVLSEFVTRAMGSGAVSGDTHDKEFTEFEVLKNMLSLMHQDESVLEQMGITPDMPIRARDVFAQMARAQLKAELGDKMPDDVADTEMLDNCVFHIFPNTWIVNSYGQTGVFTATPDVNPDKSFLTVTWFKTNLTDAPNPEAPEEILLQPGEVFNDYHTPEIGGADSEATEQDTDNMEGQQRGLRASPDGECIFADYVEGALIHHIQTIQKFTG